MFRLGSNSIGFISIRFWHISKQQQQQQFEAKGQLGGGIRDNADADAKVSADEAFETRLSRALLAALLVAGDAAAASAAAALIGALRG